jgi:hypothetical protein
MDGPLTLSPQIKNNTLRCDCPNHKVSNATWPGTPTLPGGLASNFGAALTGQFLVSRPPGGVAGEGPDLFPTASDYHLVCLQHDGAASLTVDGAAVYEGGLSADAAAGEFFFVGWDCAGWWERGATGAQARLLTPDLRPPPPKKPSDAQASSSTARPSC